MKLWRGHCFVTKWSERVWESPQNSHEEQQGQMQEEEKTAVVVAWNKEIHQPGGRLWGEKYYIRKQ